MAAPNIEVGDEVRLRWTRSGKTPIIAVVTHNTPEDFCYILPTGITGHTTRADANPIKTGRHFNIQPFLDMIR